MSSFTEAGFEPVMLADGKQKKRNGRKVYRIVGRDGNGFVFHIGYVGSGLSIHIREGFETDELSIPGLVDWAVPSSVKKKAQLSAAVHDYLCEHPLWNRDDADAQFYAAMCAEGTPACWRDIFFKAVQSNKSKARYNDESYFDDQRDLFDGARS